MMFKSEMKVGELYKYNARGAKDGRHCQKHDDVKLVFVPTNSLVLCLDFEPGVLLNKNFYAQPTRIKILVDDQIVHMSIGDHWLRNFVEINCDSSHEEI